MLVWALLPVLAMLATGRVVLPWAIEHYVNGRLQDMEAYTGSIDEVDVAVVRGTYEIKGLRLEKREGEISQPLVVAESVSFGLDWAALWHGELVGNIHARRPVFAFVDGPSESDRQTGAGPDWAKRLDSLIPFHINSFDIEDGTMSLYRTGDDGRTTPILRLHSATLRARNFTNVRESDEPVFATLTLDGQVQEAGELHLFTEIDPLSDPPVLNLDAEVIDLPLTQLNPLLEAYAKLDAEAGMVEIYVELASAAGRFDGYVKPLVRDAEVFRLDEEASFFGKVWQGAVEALKNVLENPETDRVGAEVPLEGELTAVDAQLILAVFSILENAFIEALSVGLGDIIGLEDIGLADEEGPDSDDAD